MTQSQNTGFDAFFQAITTSPEFRSTITKDWKGDSMEALEKSLQNMQTGVEKAENIMKDFDEKFSVPPTPLGEGARGGGAPKTGNPKDEEISPLKVEYFERKPDKPYGFEAVAGMDILKEELKSSFIKPLRFKFMVERLRRERADTHTDTVSAIASEVKQSSHENNSTVGLSSVTISSSPSVSSSLLERLYSEYEKFRISIPTGMLLYGPPGTGKTFITKKLAEELGCGFVAKNMGEFGSSYLHQTTKNIKDFFAGAKKAAENEPIILFLDEIDSLVSARTNSVDANKAEEVSQFLQEFNALESAPNLIVIAATNRPDHLDPAILRSGRLDKKIYLGPPDALARKALFEMYIAKTGRPHAPLDYDELAGLTDAYVSADIEAICDEVARDASRDLLELIDEAEAGTLTESDLTGHEITMEDLRGTIRETPSSLRMVDMSVYDGWLEKIS